MKPHISPKGADIRPSCRKGRQLSAFFYAHSSLGISKKHIAEKAPAALNKHRFALNREWHMLH
jgi:hypothetical protein